VVEGTTSRCDGRLHLSRSARNDSRDDFVGSRRATFDRFRLCVCVQISVDEMPDGAGDGVWCCDGIFRSEFGLDGFAVERDEVVKRGRTRVARQVRLNERVPGKRVDRVFRDVHFGELAWNACFFRQTMDRN